MRRAALLAILVLAAPAAPARAASFDGVQVGPTEWTYTLTFDPLDNFAVCPAPGNVATIAISGLSGVVRASAPTSSDFRSPLPGTLQWLPQVAADGTVVTWTHLGPGTGNFEVPKHVYGFAIETASPVPSGTVKVVSSGFSLDVGRTGPCPAQGSDLRDFVRTTTGPVDATLPPLPVIPPPAPLVSAVTLAPAARAGATVTARFTATRSDTGAPVLGGTITCTPSVGGTVLAHREWFVGGSGRLVFRIPRSAARKLLTVRVTVSLGDRPTTRVTTFRVRR